MADIHIRPLNRHTEYRNIFNKLYNEIRKNTEESIIVICGDIVHEKDKITPELIILIQEFLITFFTLLMDQKWVTNKST